MPESIGEPSDTAHVLIGEPPLQVLVIRDDASAAAMRDTDPDLPQEYRWWLSTDGDGDPLPWSAIVDSDPDPLDGLPRGLNRKAMVRLFTPQELDQAVAEAVARVSARPVGDHLREAGGLCGHCGSWHSPQEWARLEDRLAEEASRGQ